MEVGLNSGCSSLIKSGASKLLHCILILLSKVVILNFRAFNSFSCTGFKLLFGIDTEINNKKFLTTKSWVASVEPVETNILIFSLAEGYSDQLLIEKLKQKNIIISSLGHNKLRIVTHLDYKEVMHTYVIDTLSKF